MNTAGKIPTDMKIFSLVLFLSAVIYFDINRSVYPIFGYLVYGISANILWIISSIFLVICAIGFWKRKLLIWKALFFYIGFSIFNSIINYFFIPVDKRVSIVHSELPESFTPSDSVVYLLVICVFYCVLLLYLYSRRTYFGIKSD